MHFNIDCALDRKQRVFDLPDLFIIYAALISENDIGVHTYVTQRGVSYLNSRGVGSTSQIGTCHAHFFPGQFGLTNKSVQYSNIYTTRRTDDYNR